MRNTLIIIPGASMNFFNINDDAFMYKNFIIKSKLSKFMHHTKTFTFEVCNYHDYMLSIYQQLHVTFSPYVRSLNLTNYHHDGAAQSMKEHTFESDVFNTGFNLAKQRIDDFVKEREQMHYSYFYYYLLSLNKTHYASDLLLTKSFCKNEFFHELIDVGIVNHWINAYPDNNNNYTMRITEKFAKDFCIEIKRCQNDVERYNANHGIIAPKE